MADKPSNLHGQVATGLQAVNRTRDAVLAARGIVASSAWARMRGLLGRPPLEPGEGMLLRGEKAIHTIGMSYPIDVVFLDREGKVVHLQHAVAPLRLSPFVLKATDVLELPAGTLERTGTRLGDRIELHL